MDLSRCIMSTTQRGAVNNFFRDRRLTQHIRELNVSNLRVLNWQMDDHLQKFIKSICPRLEALHILDCGVTLRTLHSILNEAPQLTALSWSIWDFTSEDTEFVVKSLKSPEKNCFKNVKHLHIEMLHSMPHIRIAKYLLQSYFRDLEDLEIYTWLTNKEYYNELMIPVVADRITGYFSQPSVENELQHLRSLMVVAVGGLHYEEYNESYKSRLSDFVSSVLSRKSSSTNWKKFWILPKIRISRERLSLLHKDDFQSVEAIGADADRSQDAVDELKSFFQRIGDNALRRLHFCLPPDNDSIVEFCEPISRVSGHSLKFLRLSVHYLDEIGAEQNIFIHTLFSNCSNITKLDLLHCSFEKDICESLSKLKHLSKVQLTECAISSKHSKETQVEISKANLLIFAENCKNITHLDVRGCRAFHKHFSCRLTDDDLLALAKLRNLKCLTLYNIRHVREWAFLKNISEHCEFLTTLRISAREHFNDSHIPIVMQSVKFLKHLAIDVNVLLLGSEVFWNNLIQAKNLERLCISCHYIRHDDKGSLNIAFAVEMLKSLPRLHVLHLHSVDNVEVFHNRIHTMLEEKESDRRFSFEILTRYGKNTWINHPTGYRLISNKALPLNEAELCLMAPILRIPRS